MAQWRKRKKTYNDPGDAHYLTFSCQQHLPLLARDGSRRWVVEAIDNTRQAQEVSVWAYVIMPDHVHLLAWPRRETYSMEHFLFAIKRPVSGKARRWLEEHGEEKWLRRLMVRKGRRMVFRFWTPGGGYDQNLAQTKGIQAVADYIHNNPVRRGLVECPEEWRWSSAAFWAGERDVPLAMDPMDF